MNAGLYIQRSIRKFAAAKLVYILLAIPGFMNLATFAQQAPPSTLKWIVKPPGSAISVALDGSVPIAVVVGNAPAYRVKVLQSGLVEQSRKYPLSRYGLWLCRSPDAKACDEQIDLDADSSTMLWLRPVGGFDVGRFTGTVLISSTLKPDGDAVNLDLYVTTPSHQLWGAVTILVSVLLVWVVSIYGRARYNRGQLFLPAAFVREKLARLRAIIDRAPLKIERENILNVSRMMNTYDAQLDTTELEKAGFIPPLIPSPFGAPALKTDEYKQQLKNVDEAVSLLNAIIEDGMVAAWGMKSIDWTSQAHVKLVNETIATLDRIVSSQPLPLVTSAVTTIQAELGKLRQNLNPTQFVGPVTLPLRSYDEIRIEIRKTSIAAWLVATLLTTLLGTYVVVLSNLGFGTWTDYFLCMFWGMGLPVAATQILQQTSASAPTALGIVVGR